MCILLYMKLIWCSDITYIYGQLDVLGRSELIGCSGIQHIYDQLEEGVSSSDRYRSSENLRMSR